ncbi:MAG: hemerythrin family protein [Deltaproteobacteria bacterium]|nr:hemerythrin family protein [Deltaproteobacteria bacterium]
MTIFAWDDSIALNIPRIDEQHRELIGWINALHDAVRKDEGALVTGDVLSKLISYVFMHFTEEERLMLSCSFPGFTAHRQEHDYYVKRLKNIQDRFQEGEEISGETLEFMSDWIVCHIRGTDQVYGRFILAGSGGTGA